MGNLVKTLHGEVDRAGSDQSGQTREFTQCTANDRDLAESAAHGNKAASDFVPAILRERIERLGDITKGFGRNDHADGSGNVVLAESAEQTSDCAHLRQGAAHGR